MATNYQTYRVLIQLIHPHAQPEHLKSLLEGWDDWDTLVTVASKQLVLPALFCNLNQKDLLAYLPEDLTAYLEELTAINRNRNATLLDEIQHIHQLLRKADITHVFLKGAALISGGFYQDMGARMIGDLDILVSPEQLDQAQHLLVENGYYETEITFGKKYFEHRHLPRLNSDTHLGAVEMHRKLLVATCLNPRAVLSSLVYKNSLPIPNTKDLLAHAVLNFQINDDGSTYHYLDLRSAYDVLVLEPDLSDTDFRDVLATSKIRHYFNKLTAYASMRHSYAKSTGDRLSQKLFIWKYRYGLINGVWNQIVNLYRFVSILANRLWLLVTNKQYRRDAYRDRQRVFKILFSQNLKNR